MRERRGCFYDFSLNKKEKKMLGRFDEHVIDYVDSLRLGDVGVELDSHVQAYYQREAETWQWDPVNEEWFQL